MGYRDNNRVSSRLVGKSPARSNRYGMGTGQGQGQQQRPVIIPTRITRSSQGVGNDVNMSVTSSVSAAVFGFGPGGISRGSSSPRRSDATMTGSGAGSPRGVSVTNIVNDDFNSRSRSRTSFSSNLGSGPGTPASLSPRSPRSTGSPSPRNSLRNKNVPESDDADATAAFSNRSPNTSMNTSMNSSYGYGYYNVSMEHSKQVEEMAHQKARLSQHNYTPTTHNSHSSHSHPSQRRMPYGGDPTVSGSGTGSGSSRVAYIESPASEARTSHVLRDGLMLQTKNAFHVLEGTSSYSNRAVGGGSKGKFSYGEIDFWVETLRKLLYVHIREQLKFIDSMIPTLLKQLEHHKLPNASYEAIGKVMRIQFLH